MNKEIFFFAFGDAGENTHIKYRIAELVNKNKNARILLLGDNFYRYGIDSEHSERWKTEYENLFPGKKIYATLGNHCYMGNIAAQILYSNINKNWNLPRRYYEKKIYLDNNTYVHLIGIDTFEIAQNESIRLSLDTGMDPKVLEMYMKNFNKSKQLNWLNDTLKTSKGRWKIVFGHYPIFSNGSVHGNCKEMIDSVLPILTKNHVHLYLSGHDHNICYSTYKNLHCVVSGNGSYASNVKNDNFFFNLASKSGICYLNCKKNELEFGFNDFNDTKIFSRTLI
jgi:tartrate-resistant acid phosphatase type 5